MSSGVGRGRGWLNLRPQNAKSPGLETAPVVNNLKSLSLQNQDHKKYSDATDYSDLIYCIRQLSLNDDGILFNQKIKYIIENWYKHCENAVDVQKSFEYIHGACLEDSELASKVVLLIASRTFLSQEIHEQNIRLMFLRKLQDNFEACLQMQTDDPDLFRNSVQLMGEFFNKARLSNGQPFSFMSTPLLTYLEMLLESAEPADLKLFAVQLYLNGSNLKQECPEKMIEILNKVRSMLCSEKRYTTECKLWLALALEVSSNRFAVLPNDLNKFYQEHLGDHAMAAFQGSHATLSVQTNPNSKLDSYQSQVNVLQVSSTDAPSSESSTSDFSSMNFSSSGFVSEQSPPKSDFQAQKAGRPILGAGARLHKHRIVHNDTVNDNYDDKQITRPSNDWARNKSVNSDWHTKTKKEGSGDNWRDKGQKEQKSRANKGWEHDDRFDNDY